MITPSYAKLNSTGMLGNITSKSWTVLYSGAYGETESGLSRNDLALIELTSPIKFGDGLARPACIFEGNQTHLADYKSMVSAGFGEPERLIHLDGTLKELNNRTESNPKRLSMTSLNQVQVNSSFLQVLSGGKDASEFIFATPSVLEGTFRGANETKPSNSTNSTHLSMTKPKEPPKPSVPDPCLLSSGKLLGGLR